jgi:pimeloyl-ACP methyl ester carboxylesterase
LATIALVHAFGSSGRAWGPQIAGSASRPRSRPARPRQLRGTVHAAGAVESVVATIDEAGGKAHLVGISGGAVVTLLACLEHPDRVSSLVFSAGQTRR